MTSPFGNERDIFYMQKALAQARKAYDKDEVPVGAVIVSPEGTIVARGYNKVEKNNTQVAHAEALAIVQAGKKLRDWRLTGYWLYVTLEPCAMCINLVQLSRLSGVVFGARSPLFGHCLDKTGTVPLYNKDILTVVGNICAQESAHLLRQFFQMKRN